MYANNLEPVVCPLLALAGYIISHPSILIDQSNLFEWHYQYECFHKISNKIVQTHQFEFKFVGRTVEDFGKHSITKGSTATFIATVCTVSLPIALI